MMEQRGLGSGAVFYTIKRFSITDLSDSPLANHILTFQGGDRPADSQDLNSDSSASCVIEIVTVEVDASSSGVTRPKEGQPLRASQITQKFSISNKRTTLMIVHSEVLSQMIKDVVILDSSQALSGNDIILQEPYAVLMHHISELEGLKSGLEPKGAVAENTKLQHLQVLLDFLRPKYEKWCLPARHSLSQTQPTVRFEDIWFLMKPGTLAYTQLDDHWIGCSIEQVEKRPAERYEPESWIISICFIQMSWDTGEPGFVSTNITIDNFRGAKPVTDLPLFPRDFYDRTDSSVRRDEFEKRGEKIAQLVWEAPQHMSYEGECMDTVGQHYAGQVVVDAPRTITVTYPESDWNIDWYPFNSIHQRTLLQFQRDPVCSCAIGDKCGWKALTRDHFFIMSPCLIAFAITTQSWLPIQFCNLRNLDIPDPVPEPLLQPERLKVLNALVDSFDAQKSIIPSHITGYRRKGLTILLHGPTGVGKNFTVESICLRLRRPLVKLEPGDLKGSGKYFDNYQGQLGGLISLGEQWGAVFCVPWVDRFESDTFFRTFSSILFIINGRPQLSNNERSYRSTVELVIEFEELDGARRKVIWDRLQQSLLREKERRVQLTDSARNLLNYTEIHELKWNGHIILQCFRTAVALAEYDAKRDPEYHDGQDIVVDAENFKDAINMTDSKKELAEDHDNEYHGPIRTHRHEIDEFDPSRKQYRPLERNRAQTMKEILKTNRWPIASDTDINLCIPQLNRVEWEQFKAAASDELFRKTEFYAIDVLLKEPVIKFQSGISTWRSRPSRRPDEGVTDHKTETKSDMPTLPSGQEVLPERIRINSTTILKVFKELNDEGTLDPNRATLLFRPFRSLSYYEPEFRDWVRRQQKKIQEHVEQQHKNDGLVEPSHTGDDGVHLELDKEKAALENVRCLLTFIDEYIKPKKEFIKSPLCHTIAFADIWYLFNPGDTVINRDSRQAYRVIEVRSTKHQVRKPSKEMPTFWRDDSTVEFEDNPVFIHCVYIDFDGTLIGPVNEMFAISNYTGIKEIRSLPIYPLRFVGDLSLEPKLVERGKLFFEVAKVKHMHYSGLTLHARDEVDSQVVVDFEEAIGRNPEWKPQVKSIFGFDMTQKMKEARGLEPAVARMTPMMRYDKQEEDTGDRDTRVAWCVEECCADEITHDDEYVEASLRDEHIRSRMNDTTSTAASIAIVPQPLNRINAVDALRDEDFFIMANRAFGFVLRNRKWARLDLEKMTEVAVLGEDKGFDQLVLPSGHKDMVKGMIRQHFQDKKFMQDDVNQTDIVRGKGKGLIMLLHGAPGVGKTSTAECVADSFRRPLFQITSGDLGTTAKEVEEALETNFSLANRWNCILLIDEADVFLAERTKEDFVRNSLVAVFLRIMEYYAGVLFLTTNRVGVFDEAFTSRIHISLYYPPLERDSTHKIFEKNMERIKARYEINSRKVEIKVSEISKFALDYFDENKKNRWNGRQIRNAFQSAIALAELDANDKDGLMGEPDPNRSVTLGRKQFEVVAATYKGFTDYLNQTYGVGMARRARENLWRSDTFGMTKAPNALTTRLKTADPWQPPPDAWSQANYANYGPNSGMRPPYPPPPQGGYSYPYPPGPYQAADPRYNPGLAPNQSRDPRERPSNPAAYDAQPESISGPQGSFAAAGAYGAHMHSGESSNWNVSGRGAGPSGN